MRIFLILFFVSWPILATQSLPSCLPNDQGDENMTPEETAVWRVIDKLKKEGKVVRDGSESSQLIEGGGYYENPFKQIRAFYSTFQPHDVRGIFSEYFNGEINQSFLGTCYVEHYSKYYESYSYSIYNIELKVKYHPLFIPSVIKNKTTSFVPYELRIKPMTMYSYRWIPKVDSVEVFLKWKSICKNDENGHYLMGSHTGTYVLHPNPNPILDETDNVINTYHTICIVPLVKNPDFSAPK